ncbi:MAG: M48 family metalloprotease, partial [Bdellovibrionota bacterium]
MKCYLKNSAFWLAAIFFAHTFFPSFGTGAALPASQHDQAAEKEVGPLFSPNQLPRELDAWLNRLVVSLGPATQKVVDRVLGPGNSKYLKFRIRVVDSSTPNAFMVSDAVAKNGVTSVYLTLPLLKGIFAEGQDADILDGILAHEFAHLVDKLNPHGVEKAAKAKGGMAQIQARPSIELLTDGYATEILVEADLDPGSLTRGLNWIHKILPQRPTFADALLSSHPRSGFRETHARLTTFGWRFVSGTAPEARAISPPQALRDAVARMPVRPKYPAVPLPQITTIEDVIREFRKFDPATP